MIYYSGISIKHLDRWDFPDDTPRFSSAQDCYRMFLGMHLKMMRFGHGEYDPYYARYQACVRHFNNRLKLNYQEFKNVMANIVESTSSFSTNPCPDGSGRPSWIRSASLNA